jgi:hypothetical protein
MAFKQNWGNFTPHYVNILNVAFRETKDKNFYVNKFLVKFSPLSNFLFAQLTHN